VQLHGGLGYTWEHDMHLALKRAKLNQALLGTSRWHRRRLAELVL
jgi:alkylation response protein AidB-like acyl-CoA dehydrogenase